MIDTPPRRPLLWACLTLTGATTLAAPSAHAQTMYVPAPEKPSPRPAWNCRAKQSVGATNIHASRLLDANGAALSDGAGWTDIFTADTKATLTVSVNWPTSPSPMTFGSGHVTLYFRTAQPMKGPIGLLIGGRRAIKLDAAQSYDDPHNFAARTPIATLIEATGGDSALEWVLRGTVPGTGAPVAYQGNYVMDEVRALEAGFARVLAQLDAMQADFAARCIRL